MSSAPAPVYNSQSPVIAQFPRRPLQLQAVHVRSSWRTRILTVVGAIVIAGGTLASTRGLIDEYSLRTTGTPALVSHMDHGKCDEWLVFNCSLTARYTLLDGSSHSTGVHYYTILQKPDTDKRFLVRYDPASPDRVSTSWGTGLLVNRTITTLLGFVFCIGLAVAGISTIGSKGRRQRELDTIGAHPTPLDVKFVRAVTAPNSPQATIRFTWTDATGAAREGASEFVGAREPFWLDAAKTRMLAIAGANDKLYLLDSRLESVSLTPQERAQLTSIRDRSIQTA